MNCKVWVGKRRESRWLGAKMVAAAAFLSYIAVAFFPNVASATAINACVSKKGAITILLKSACKTGATELTWNTIGPAGATGVAGAPGATGVAGVAGVAGPTGPAGGPTGPAGPTGPSGTLGPVANVQTLNLVNGSSQVLATLTAAPDGGGSLTFFDSSGKRFMLVGVDDAGTAAGLSAFDGNTLASGTGVTRTFIGVSGSADATPGFGMGVVGANGTSRRVELGSSLDGTTLPSNVDLYDSSGNMRTGITVSPSTNYVGFFSGSYTPEGTGPNESITGNAYDNSASYSFVYDSSGNLRNGIQYNPSVNFNGFVSQDGAGHSLASVGNFLTTNAGLSEQANESYLDLSDTSGTLRLFEFQNSTVEGGVDFAPGSTTVLGSWGNP